MAHWKWTLVQSTSAMCKLVLHSATTWRYSTHLTSVCNLTLNSTLRILNMGWARLIWISNCHFLSCRLPIVILRVRLGKCSILSFVRVRIVRLIWFWRFRLGIKIRIVNQLLLVRVQLRLLVNSRRLRYAIWGIQEYQQVFYGILSRLTDLMLRF